MLEQSSLYLTSGEMMSILAKLLNKKEEPQDSGQIPPGLLKSVASGGSGRFQRRTYLLIAAGAVAAVVCGVLLVLYLQGRPTGQPQIVRQPVAIPQLPVQTAVQLPVSSAAATESSPTAVKTAAHPVTPKRSRRYAASASPRVENKPPASRSKQVQKRDSPKKDQSTINAYLFAARTAEAKREYNQALNQYRQALKADPDNYRIMNNIASTLLRMGQYNEALINVIRALTLKNDYVSALINGGIAYSKRGDYASALGMFSRAVELEPDNKAALYNLALSQEKKGALDDALASFRLLANHGDVQGYLGMARILERKDNKGEALSLYRKITEMPNIDDAARNIARKRILILD
jgi:Tfp pilus assembly protein PilF